MYKQKNVLWMVYQVSVKDMRPIRARTVLRNLRNMAAWRWQSMKYYQAIEDMYS